MGKTTLNTTSDITTLPCLKTTAKRINLLKYKLNFNNIDDLLNFVLDKFEKDVIG